MKDESEKSNIDEKAYHLIILVLRDKALREVLEETIIEGVRNKLEQLTLYGELTFKQVIFERKTLWI